MVILQRNNGRVFESVGDGIIGAFAECNEFWMWPFLWNKWRVDKFKEIQSARGQSMMIKRIR